MLVVHHLNDSRSQRILWLLEELGAPYEIKPYARDATTRLAPRSMNIHAPPVPCNEAGMPCCLAIAPKRATVWPEPRATATVGS